jgi:hypothetical protein
MGARGAYAASPQLSGAQFRAYVESRDLSGEFPGIRGLGFIQRVLRDDLPRFQAAVRAEGAQAFSVNAPGTAADLYVIRYIEPLAANLPAWGYDLGSDPKRRSAVETAILAGRPTLSERITLLQDAQQGPGFLFLLPVYHGGVVPENEEDRLRLLHGVLYTPIVAREIFEGVAEAANGRLDFEVFDGPDTSRANLVYDLGQTPHKPAVAQHPRASLRPALRDPRLAHHRRPRLRPARPFAAHVRQRLQPRGGVGRRAGRCRAHAAGRLGCLAAGRRAGTHPAGARANSRPTWTGWRRSSSTRPTPRPSPMRKAASPGPTPPSRACRATPAKKPWAARRRIWWTAARTRQRCWRGCNRGCAKASKPTPRCSTAPRMATSTGCTSTCSPCATPPARSPASWRSAPTSPPPTPRPRPWPRNAHVWRASSPARTPARARSTCAPASCA